MSYRVSYTAFCGRGKVRPKNQDNLWCAGVYLPSENDGLAEPLVGYREAQDLPVFAVFDGMGGEQQGEVAAYLAADTFDEACKERALGSPKAFLKDACAQMNARICAYAEGNGVSRMGTTAAIVMFARDEVFICNLGDSRVYQFSGKSFEQISFDHSEPGVVDRKPPLTQCLGIPETEFTIDPYIARGDYRAGDKYLICSDGLTDMVPKTEIEHILSIQKDLAISGQMLVEAAMENGGRDNITVILCEVSRQRPFFFKGK